MPKCFWCDSPGGLHVDTQLCRQLLYDKYKAVQERARLAEERWERVSTAWWDYRAEGAVDYSHNLNEKYELLCDLFNEYEGAAE